MPANQINVTSAISQTVNLPTGALTQQTGGLQGDAWMSPLHGTHYAATYSGNTFFASVTAVTVPVIAQSFVSVFSLWNPNNSACNLELIKADVGIVTATTVVNHVGLYYMSSAAPTLTTAATAYNRKLGAGNTSQGKPYSALTHVGATPVLAAIVATFGAVTTTGDNPISYDFDGSILVPPGTVVSFAMSTAAGNTSGLALGLTWAEWPI